MDNNRKLNIYQKSIVLIGPAGSGKTLVSEALTKKLGLPHLSMDKLRLLPSTDTINASLEHARQQLQQAEKTKEVFIETCQSLMDKKLFESALEKKESHCTDCRFQLEKCMEYAKTRSQFSNIKSYYDFGFDKELDSLVNKVLKSRGEFCYRKQFEDQLLLSIMDNIDKPYIIDLGCTTPVAVSCLTGDTYKKMLTITSLYAASQETTTKNNDFTLLTQDELKWILRSFAHVIYLKLPKDYHNVYKANDLKVNKDLIQSGAYETIATDIIDVTGLIDGMTPNQSKLNEIVDKICRIYTGSTPSEPVKKNPTAPSRTM